MAVMLYGMPGAFFLLMRVHYVAKKVNKQVLVKIMNFKFE